MGLTVSAGTATAGFIDLYEDEDSANDYYVRILAPTITEGGNIDLYLPPDEGDNTNILATDGAGNTYWTSAGAATAWNNIVNPGVNAAIDHAGYYTTMDFGDVDNDMFTIWATEAFGNYSVMRIEQKTGDPTDGDLLSLVTADGEAHVDNLVLANGTDDYVTHRIVEAGTYTIDVTSDGTAAVDFVDGVTANSLTSDAGLAIMNDGYIGSAGDGNAIQIEADGDIVFTDDLAVVNVVSSGAVTVGTDLIMTTNTGGYILVADGSDYEEVAMSQDATIASGGAVTIADSVTVATWTLNAFTLTGDVTATGAAYDWDMNDNVADALEFDVAGATSTPLAIDTIDLYEGVRMLTRQFNSDDSDVGAVSDNDDAAITLTPDEVSGTVINTWHDTPAAMTYTLPPAVHGYAFVLALATAENVVIVPNASEIIYLNGTAIAGGNSITEASGAIGESITCYTLQTGATTWGWICTSGDDWADLGS
jgi:hypothetical protein